MEIQTLVRKLSDQANACVLQDREGALMATDAARILGMPVPGGKQPLPLSEVVDQLVRVTLMGLDGDSLEFGEVRYGDCPMELLKSKIEACKELHHSLEKVKAPHFVHLAKPLEEAVWDQLEFLEMTLEVRERFTELVDGLNQNGQLAVLLALGVDQEHELSPDQQKAVEALRPHAMVIERIWGRLKQYDERHLPESVQAIYAQVLTLHHVLNEYYA